MQTIVDIKRACCYDCPNVNNKACSGLGQTHLQPIAAATTV